MNGKAPSYLPKPPVNGDDRFATVSVPSGGAETTVMSFRTRTGQRPFIVAIATNTGGSPDNITWNVKADGAKLYPWADFGVSPSDPSLWDFLGWPIEVSQNCELSITAKNAGASAANCTGRLIVYYTEP